MHMAAPELTEIAPSEPIACDAATIAPDLLAQFPPPPNEALAQPAQFADDEWLAAFIERSGLLDTAYYLKQADTVCETTFDAALDYIRRGEPKALKPNPYFDPAWYAQKYFKAPFPAGALRDYLCGGEQRGRKPCPVFEPQWYATTYGLDLAAHLALAHYLGARASNLVAPNKYFDPIYYLNNNSDIAIANMDAFEHWYRWGIFEYRQDTPAFDKNYVWKTHLGGDQHLHPFEIFMDIGVAYGWHPKAPEDAGPTVHREIRKYAAPGPLFEDWAPLAADTPRLAKVLALYLPQFHAIPENDAWWGAGFTEWRNLPRGAPRYVGHYQPRIPRDLGFYSLDSTATMRRQIDLAKRAGIFGFCFYYYNFNGHRLLETPVEAFLGDASLDMPFCIMWANENWTRRWDGAESNVLMQQDYRAADGPALVADLARHMRDPRYLRVGAGRPLLFVYRPDIIPDCAATVAAWRGYFRTGHGLDPVIVMAQTFGITDPQPFGFDGALEFPPHVLGANLEYLNPKLDLLDADFTGQVSDYRHLVAASLAVPPRDYPLIKTALPGWDNDARRQGTGLSYIGSTPRQFQGWLAALAERACSRPFFGEPLVCVNAWNEWCEGAYLEPDVHFGYAYLNALARAVAGDPPAASTAPPIQPPIRGSQC